MNNIKSKLNKFFSSLSSKLKNIRLSRRLKIFLIVLIVIVILFGLFSYAVNISKAGDLLFTLKGFAEERELSLYKGKEADFYLIKLKDRVQAFQSLANNNQCVQLLLAQDEVISTIKSIQTNQYYINKTNDIVQILTPLNNLKTNCNISDAIDHLSNIYSFMQFYYSSVNSQKGSLLNERNSLESQYTTSANRLQNTSFTSQDKINQTASLLLIVKRSVENFDKTKDDPKSNLLNDLSFSASKVSLEAFNTVFTTDISQVNGFKSDVQAICLIYSDKDQCSKESINGKWNSIYEKTDLGSQILLGEDVFKSYLVFLIPDAKFN